MTDWYTVPLPSKKVVSYAYRILLTYKSFQRGNTACFILDFQKA